MRAAWCSLLLAACSADIVPGAYLCGPEQACPGDLVCSGSDNTCESAATAEAFACGTTASNTPATATELHALACVSPVVTDDDCLGAGVTASWFHFATPSNCVAVAVTMHVTYPVAYESIGLALADGNGATLASDTPCTVPGADSDERCLAMTLANATDYTIDVMPEGGGDCGGACNFNRYTLTVQLQTPN